jgi:hypothetical protein
MESHRFQHIDPERIVMPDAFELDGKVNGTP